VRASRGGNDNNVWIVTARVHKLRVDRNSGLVEDERT